MQVKNATQTGLRSEINIVPAWAWGLAVVAFLFTQVFFNVFSNVFSNVVVAQHSNAPPAWARAVLGGLLGIVLGCYLLFIGYINRDAKRRGMSPIPWTLVAIAIPYGLGIVLYFILRQPLRGACPQCGNAVQTEFNFCPRCRYKLSPSCPHCQRVVGVNDVYCPYCATSLRNQAAP